LARVIAFANQKGGVAKTTSTLNLAVALAEQGLSVLAIDLDPQAGFTTSLGHDPEGFEKTTYDVFCEGASIAEVLYKTPYENFHFVPAKLDLSGAEAKLIGEPGWDRILKSALEAITAHYTHIVIDCPPSLGVLTINALTAAQVVIVPLQCEYLAMNGLKQFQTIFTKVKERSNPELEMKVLRTMYDARTTHAREVSEEIQKVFGEKVFRPIIKRSIKFADATAAGQPILAYAAESELAQAYRDLAGEI
jgi:chromosome partitioning protein